MSDTQKTAVIFGLANKRSIAWAIAQKLHAAGWRLAITYQNERLEHEARRPGEIGDQVFGFLLQAGGWRSPIRMSAWGRQPKTRPEGYQGRRGGRVVVASR